MNGLDLAILAQRARDLAFSKLVAGGFHRFGKGSRICLPFRIGPGQGKHISIGENVLISANCMLLVPSADAPTPALVIGDRVRMNTTAITAVLSVVIEDGVDMARGVYISDHSHGFEDPDTFVRDQPLKKIAPVRIGAGAWIGENAVIMPGVTIGRGSVIGANAVVREDVPDYSVAAGVPARVLRTFA
ncbi:transferase hexapeptide (six repeat-containing protein) [Rathayibacter oskolensis]|uniref:Transferase hexapeptide (Six repeat-containing protein) n=1 Tax=Rathayibacter oskolensis TaxID=1891671 RepID=A0A1X7MSD7_9MICO|nr:acyltransferase [Rathayibacter oskolensis]SMH27749.1 transferase hexapeptide (six repeat-containing protein) [Rathayibacter oskolensis]